MRNCIRLILITVVLSLSAVCVISCGEGGGRRQTDEVCGCMERSCLEARLGDYMSTFPQSQLRDVYKFCFQDFFGLEHLLSDSLAALRYIESEMAYADSADWQLPLFHYPLLDSHYVRFDINYVRQGVIPADKLVSAMLKSVGKSSFGSEDLERWKKCWGDILSVLQDMGDKRPLCFDEDRATIDSLFAGGHYALHHSKLYNATYRQHYRIVSSEVFQSDLLPLIGEE